ncbi:MAG: hypothetical protein Ct9H300mP14_00670 [Gammaproteobacteria bacterium]|nr:MAG: hypothetical protein Ct9H300mP14_00670 [Gammaproteobacteria bacterium]
MFTRSKHEAHRITLVSVWDFALILDFVKVFFGSFRRGVGRGPSFNLGTRNADGGVSATMGHVEVDTKVPQH